LTSGHKLIAIIAVWAATAIAYAIFSGVAISRFLEPGTISLLTAIMLGAAAAATFFIARSRLNA
jgi:hypothetical protein